ncbi:urease accessory protein UreE [Leptolyngbya sp. BL0902]|nr:urease accessory protein UreE [Leptolyngbya sp. BL0902]
MLTVTQILSADPAAVVVAELALTAEERTRSRHRFVATDGTPVQLQLPRGSVVRGNSLLSTAEGQRVRVVAKAEPVLQVTAASAWSLMRAAYHLGNRHVPLEITPHSLRLEPDSVLEAMLNQLGDLTVQTLTLPFEPEAGAYQSSHAHSPPTHHPHTHSSHNHGSHHHDN